MANPKMLVMVAETIPHVDPESHLRPGTPKLDAAVAALAAFYSERRADLVRMLNEIALERVRSALRRAYPERLVRRKRQG